MAKYQTTLPNSAVPITEQDGIAAREWYRYWSDLFTYTGIGSGPKTIGAFYANNTQTAAANTPTAVALTSSIATNIDLTTPQMTFMKTAPHQFYATLSFTSSVADTAVAYLTVNSAEVANSGRSVPVPASGIDGAAIITLNIAYQFTAGDIAELIWINLGGNAKIHSVAAGTTPAVPGVTVTVTQLD